MSPAPTAAIFAARAAACNTAEPLALITFGTIEAISDAVPTAAVFKLANFEIILDSTGGTIKRRPGEET